MSRSNGSRKGVKKGKARLDKEPWANRPHMDKKTCCRIERHRAKQTTPDEDAVTRGAI